MIKSCFEKECNIRYLHVRQVSWVFLDSYMCNQLLQTNVITKYNLSSLREFVFGNVAIARDIHERLIELLPNVSIVQVYSTYKFNYL